MTSSEEIKTVTKNPNRVEASKKSYQKRMLKMKDDILKNASTNDTNVGTNAEIDEKSKGTNASEGSTKKSYDAYSTQVLE